MESCPSSQFDSHPWQEYSILPEKPILKNAKTGLTWEGEAPAEPMYNMIPGGIRLTRRFSLLFLTTQPIPLPQIR